MAFSISGCTTNRSETMIDIDLQSASAGIADSILGANVAQVSADFAKNHITITFVNGPRICKLDVIPKGIHWDYDDKSN